MDVAQQFEEELITRQKELRKGVVGESEVQRFYRGSVIFVTGGSGFLGKQLIEKLIRSCKVAKVYMLLRPKKGKDVQQRLDELLTEAVFDTLRQNEPDFGRKIVAIKGDVEEIQFSLSRQDWKTLTEEVDAIFHVAATTRFDETLQRATLINLRGSRECLALGKDCKKLRTYVHVSTAYTHATRRLIGHQVDEKFYESPIPPQAMISMVETMEEHRLSDITTGLIKDWPNTYTFTKALSEELIRTTSDGLPICIVRPGIVMCSNAEPAPGWTDKSSVYSAVGLCLGIGVGVLHAIHCNMDAKLGIVPCDYVTNALIAAGREAALTQRKGGRDTKIYTVSSTFRNPVTWRVLSVPMRTVGPKYMTPKSVYYAYAFETSNKLLFMILSLLLHIIPAALADALCFLIGKERKFVNLSKKVYNMCNALAYFLNNEWLLIDRNTHELYKNLNDVDKTEFNFDVSDINWAEYIIINYMGVRKYIIKDGLKDTAYGKKKQRVFEIIHYLIIGLYLFAFWSVCRFVFGRFL